MTGYQETLTDPSYAGQIVAMTAPHIGNTGVNDEDPESHRIWVSGYVVREPSRLASSWRARRSLDDELKAQGIPGIAVPGTRALTMRIREQGAMRAAVSTVEDDPRRLLDRVLASPGMTGADLARTVTTPHPYTVSPPAGTATRYRVAAVDLGIKAATPRNMAKRGMEARVLPATVTAGEILATDPDGVFFSNGPGDPAAAGYAVAAMRGVLEAGVPVFGICFGSQILGRAIGLSTYKLRYGHRGVNQPVMDLATGRVYITSHNHGFAAALPWGDDPPGSPPAHGGLPVPPQSPAGAVRHPVRGGRGQPRQPQRRRGRGHPPPRPPRLQRPVPPGGRPRPARRGRPLRPVRRPDGQRPMTPPRPRDGGEWPIVPLLWRSMAHRPPSRAAAKRGAPMPRREDLKSVLVIGSGPIVIGQGCEFDYSGTQACRVLRAEGIRVSLVNSNPATIMTDPEFADATYVEPITPDILEKVIAKERPDALLPTLGGQTALNAAVALHASGALKKYNVELIGADIDAIEACEDRERFKEIVTALGAEVPRSQICRTLDECFAAISRTSACPVVVRPSFTLGGAGSGIAYNEDGLRRIAGAGLDASPTTEVLLEESIIGWKEFELELMRDRNDNVVIVCSIENVDPMGVHTGDWSPSPPR